MICMRRNAGCWNRGVHKCVVNTQFLLYNATLHAFFMQYPKCFETHFTQNSHVFLKPVNIHVVAIGPLALYGTFQTGTIGQGFFPLIFIRSYVGITMLVYTLEYSSACIAT